MSSLTLLLLALLACGAGTEPPAVAPAPVATAPVATTPAATTPEPGAAAIGGAEPSPECLARADAADGTVDHVVHKCANCALVMSGDARHTSTHAGYTFHSCSEGCKLALDADPAKVLARACGN